MNKNYINKGFSIIELIIVIVILSILATGAYILWPGGGQELDAATYQVANDVRYAQSLSMSLNERYELHFGGNSYSIQHLIGSPPALQKLIHPATGTADVVLDHSISFTTAGCIAFDGRGELQSCGGVILGAITLQKTGAGTQTMTIAPQTGYVEVQ